MAIKPIPHQQEMIWPSSFDSDFDSYPSFPMETEMLDFMALAMDYARQLKRGNYHQAADAATQMIELLEQYPALGNEVEYLKLYQQRAVCYAMDKDYDAALNDLAFIERNVSVSEESEVKVEEGLIHILQGTEASVLNGPASKGDALALLLLNEPENKSAPKTEWFLLPREVRIQKMLEGRHYSAVIEEIDQMGNRPAEHWIALRGACYALRGNFIQAVNDLKWANVNYFSKQSSALAAVYAMVGEREKALKALKKTYWGETGELKTALVRQWIDKVAPEPTCPAYFIDNAKVKLLQFLKALNPQMDSEKLKFIESRYYVWPDASLGVPVPGQDYAQVATPGFILQFQFENGTFYVHTDETGSRYVLTPEIALNT